MLNDTPLSFPNPPLALLLLHAPMMETVDESCILSDFILLLPVAQRED